MVDLTWSQAEAKDLSNSLVQYTNCILLRNRHFVEESLWVENGKVVDALRIFYEQKRMPDYRIDCKDMFIAPGFIDVQVNGGFGVNLSHDHEDLVSQLDKLAMSLPRSGVTAFCPTLISSTTSFYQKALRSYKARPGGSLRGAAVLGLHLEGPFISKSRAGAHKVEYITEEFGENCEMLKHMYGRDLTEVRIVTLAPELPNGMDAIRHLSRKGIRVSIGHCKASLSIGLRAIECGATGITHLFNAMSPFHHRDPCLPGVLASVDRKVYYGIIADEVHCHKEALALAHRVYPRGMMLVTDSVTAMGLGEGVHQLGDVTFVVNGRRATVADTNTLIGGITPMNDCIRSLMKATKCACEIALNCASLHPAEFLGITHKKGRLQPGCDADFVLLDGDMNIMATYIGGNRVYENVKPATS